MRSTRRVVVLISLCLFLAASFIAVAGAEDGAPGLEVADEASQGSASPAAAATAQTNEAVPVSDEAAAVEEPVTEEPVIAEAEAEADAEVAEDVGESDTLAEGTEEVAEDEVEVQQEAAEGVLQISATGGDTLVQVGGTLVYTISVTNTGADALTGVVVEATLPPQLQVTQTGGTLAGNTVTWTLPSLPPGGARDLGVGVRVAGSGDLRAVTTVNATAEALAEPVERTLTTYIAALQGRTVSNPTPRIFEERTVHRPREVVVSPDDRSSVAGTILPVTGMPLGLLVGLAMFLMLCGAIVLGRAAGLLRASSTRVAIMCLLVLAACTTDAERPSERAAPEAPVTSPAPDDGEDPDDDEVLGTVVEPEDVEEGDGETGADDGSEEAADEPAAAEAPAPAPQTVTVFERVETRRLLSVDEIPVQTLGSTPGANSVSLEWSGSAITTAASSIVFDRDAVASVTTALSGSGGAVVADVTLTNLMPGQRLAVRGHLVHEVNGPGGFNAVLRSDEINLVLNPEGSTTYRFTYALPAGAFGLTSSFQTSA